MNQKQRNPLTPFGKRVKKRMIDLNMTHAELCRAVGCRSQTYMNDILAGRRSGDKYIPLICQTLKLPHSAGDGRD